MFRVQLRRVVGFKILTGRVLVLAGYLWLLLGCGSTDNHAERAGTPALAEAYKTKIELSHLGLAKGESYLGDAVHYVEGEIKNTGERVVQRVDLKLLFRDTMNQVVLKETRRALDYKGPKGLDPQKTAKFQIGFDHLPKDWNYALPEIQVSGISLK
jgi:hypothetical protein